MYIFYSTILTLPRTSPSHVLYFFGYHCGCLLILHASVCSITKHPGLLFSVSPKAENVAISPAKEVAHAKRNKSYRLRHRQMEISHEMSLMSLTLQPSLMRVCYSN